MRTTCTCVAARFGGDEFLLLTPDTDPEEARQVGERLRSEVHECKVVDGEVTMSITVGVASFPEHASDIEEIIKRADDAMYEAKRAGKNRVCVASPLAASKAVAAAPPPSSAQ